MAFLIVEKGRSQDIGRRIPLGEEAVIIGRASTGSKADIKIHDDFVSRQHAEICYQQNRYILRDLESTNGTQLDGKRIIPGEIYPLAHNSTVGFGISREDVRVLIRFKESPTTSTARIDEVDSDIINELEWLKVDEDKSEVWVDGKPLILSKKEYQLMVFLCQRPGKICSRDDIIAGVWPEVADKTGVSDAAIDQMIHRLRTKIEPDLSQPVRLISRKGFGYMLV